MRKYLINGLLTAVLLSGIAISQTREPKPVTKAGLAKSLLTLADKAEKNGMKTEATIILNAASQIMNSK